MPAEPREHEYRITKPGGACVWRGHAPTPADAMARARRALGNFYAPFKMDTWTVQRADLPRRP